MDDAQFRHVFPGLLGLRRRQDILHYLAAHPDWFILSTIGDATGFAILVTHLPMRSHGSVRYHGGGPTDLRSRACAAPMTGVALAHPRATREVALSADDALRTSRRHAAHIAPREGRPHIAHAPWRSVRADALAIRVGSCGQGGSSASDPWSATASALRCAVRNPANAAPLGARRSVPGRSPERRPWPMCPGQCATAATSAA